MKITSCLHTAILVSDVEKSAQFYQNVLGLTKIERPLKYAGVWYQVGDYQIHLIVHPELENTLKNSEKLGRNPHIALGIDNIDEIKERLERLGYPIQLSASGRAALFTQDPDGNVIEISQV